ncbi:MAG TPA: histidine--tRNA ligase, partial [Acidimicrobiales bacterium]
PADSAPWEAVVTIFARVVEAAGYGLIITPTFEDLGVFQRLGESTDVVRKEMYDFEDKGGRHIALRPETTAQVARAFIEHRPPVPWKCWYAGSNFRYERPQAGRFREFHQIGIEAFGSADADLDVEVIALGWEFYDAVGLEERRLLLNSLGDAVCRPAYRELLLDYLRSRQAELCDEHRDRLDENPLRVLDCKRPACQAVVAGAPRQIDHLCDDCAAHLARVEAGLGALQIPVTIDSRLVRGLDYYTRTTFEYVATGLESAQNAVGGGGRYDGLVGAMGGPPTPGVGFALGVERILLATGAGRGEDSRLAARRAPDAFVVDFAGGEAARDLTARLRAAGLRADRAFDGRSPKAQFRAADRSGARLALVVGPDEAAAGQVGVRDLVAGGEQVTVAVDDIVEAVQARLGGPGPR